MNRLLDRVESDRARIHYLAGRSVRARDIEREFVARELRDSFAQSLAAVSMQLTAVRAHADSALAEAIDRTRELAQDLTEEMCSVAETLYPGTLGEFGLVNAIEALARRVSRRSGLNIQIKAELKREDLSAQLASALYRVADEALRNVEQHAHATNAIVTMRSNGTVTLEIEDDGRGVDMRSADPLQSGLGLFSAKAVLALAGGELQISSGPGLGTRIVARAPIAAPKESK
jgi:signal transduction histidine kinase